MSTIVCHVISLPNFVISPHETPAKILTVPFYIVIIITVIKRTKLKGTLAMQNHVLTYANNFKHLYRQTFQPLSEQYGLSQLEIDILLFLKNNPLNNTAKEISVMRGFAKSNVSKAVESLRIEGYLSSAPDPASRKIRRLYLSAGMKDRIDALSQCQEQCFALLLDGFTAEERCTLQEFFKKIDENITKSLNHKKHES